METFLYLIPISVLLGLIGLVGFLWSLRGGQYDDLDGAAERILYDEDHPKRPNTTAASDAADDTP